MGLNKTTGVNSKTYLSIAHGTIRHTNKATGKIESYSSLEGTLSDIYKKKRTYNGQEGEYWYIDIKDKEDIYSLSFPYSSGSFKSIINSLSSVSSLSPLSIIRIEPYEKNNFTKVVVYCNDSKLDWAFKEMPPVKDITLPDGKTVKDDRERMAFFEELASQIKAKIAPLSHKTNKYKGGLS